jgi:hypothetical protein
VAGVASGSEVYRLETVDVGLDDLEQLGYVGSVEFVLFKALFDCFYELFGVALAVERGDVGGDGGVVDLVGFPVVVVVVVFVD